jgi:Protein of unknown function (DUF3500)
MSEIAPRRAVAGRMAGAASALVASLDDAQTQLAAWPFPAEGERRRWFYTPTDHGGLALSSMRPGQHQLTMKLVASGLSRAGYVTVATIIGLENVLDELEHWNSAWDRERGRDPGLYFVRIFGDPDGATWSWRFGGHHVSINHLVVDGEVVSSTPCFLGADPAASPLLGPHQLRPLAGAEDVARELVRSLDPEQRSVAMLSPVPPVDLVTANRPRVTEGDLPLPITDIWRGRFGGELGERLHTFQEEAERQVGLTSDHLEALGIGAHPKGVSGAALRPDQREVLRALLDVYTRRIPDGLAEEQSAKYSGALIENMCFAWAGGTEPGQPHYYRVEGSRMLAEYDNTQRGANHVHAVWRDLDNDFGGDVLTEHYRQSPHHDHEHRH